MESLPTRVVTILYVRVVCAMRIVNLQDLIAIIYTVFNETLLGFSFAQTIC